MCRDAFFGGGVVFLIKNFSAMHRNAGHASPPFSPSVFGDDAARKMRRSLSPSFLWYSSIRTSVIPNYPACLPLSAVAGARTRRGAGSAGPGRCTGEQRWETLLAPRSMLHHSAPFNFTRTMTFRELSHFPTFY
jgi:hypothetical protein